jgi:hypothetical protein
MQNVDISGLIEWLTIVAGGPKSILHLCEGGPDGFNCGMRLTRQ